MPRKGRSYEEIVHALHQVEGGEKITEVCRRLGVSEQTFYRWKRQFEGLGVSELRELRSLRHENSKLKQVVADLTPRSAHPPGDRTKKAVKPRARCTLAEWAQTVYRLSQRRAAGLIPVHESVSRTAGNKSPSNARRGGGVKGGAAAEGHP